MNKIPQNKIWKQQNLGDGFNDIVKSYNLDLASEQGFLKLFPRLVLNTGSDDDADLKIPFAIVYNNTLSKWHVGSGAVMFVGGDLPNEAFTQDAATTPPSFETTTRPDIAVFTAANGDEYTYGMSAELFKLNIGGTAWGSAITGLGGSTNGAPLIPFLGRLYYRIGRASMGSINASDTPVAPTNTYALALNDNAQEINCGKATSDFIFLGTIARPGRKARVHKWNGSSTAVTATYEIDAQGVLSMGIVNNTPWILDSNGALRIFNGGAFVEVDRLPYKKGQIIRPVSGASATHLCHYNGMTVDGDRIFININSTLADGTTYDNVPSGLWEYNPTNKLFHHGSPTTTKSGSAIVDYGAQKISATGAISMAKVSDSTTNGTILTGFSYYSDATTVKHGIFYDDNNDTLQKAGSLIISRIPSENVTDIWQKIYAILGRKFLSATDKIVLKARTEEDEPTEATITYTSTTTFTVAASAFTTAPVEGDEVEILQGVGAGRCAHITAVTGTTTLTITVDETITGATTQTTKARFQTWKKLGSYNAQTDDFFKLPVDQSQLGASPWFQIKAWILWTGKNKLSHLIVSNKVNEKIE
jgi:hypothetical protein